MDDVDKNQFILRWSIKNILDTDFYNRYVLKSPTFEAKCLGNTKWRLYLYMCGGTESEKKHLEIWLILDGCDDASLDDGKLCLNFRFRLLSSDGEFSIVSSVLNHTFRYISDSTSYQLIDIGDLLKERRSWTEDSVIVMCYMENAYNVSSPMVHETEDIDCEAETFCESHSRSFDCYFKFNNYENWSESKKIVDLNITYELTLKYVQNEMKVEWLSRMDDDWEHWIAFTMELISTNDEKTASIYEIDCFINNGKVFFRDYISKQKLEEAGWFTNKEIRLSGEFKRIYCRRLSYPKNKNKSENKSFAEFNKYCRPHLQQDFRNLLDDKHFVDVKLRVANEIFLVHKVILASRSPVFLAMFNHDMVEISTGIIDICDVDTRSMKLFLEFMYTGEMREIDEEIAMSMLMLANKYQVTSLKEVSSEFLMSVLSVNNACNIMSVADLVNCDDLKLSAAEYSKKFDLCRIDQH